MPDDRVICYVKWIESSVLNEQIEPHEAPKPVEVESVGFVVAETYDYITLARDVMDDGDLRGCVSIPKAIIYLTQPGWSILSQPVIGCLTCGGERVRFPRWGWSFFLRVVPFLGWSYCVPHASP